MVNDILDCYNKLVSPYSIVYAINKIHNKSYELPIHLFVSNVGVFSKKCKNIVTSGCSGGGFNHEEALRAVLGESVERYSWCNPTTKNIIFSKESDLKDAFCPLEISSFIYHHDLPKSIILKEFKNIKTPWKKAINLTYSKEILVPVIDLYNEFLPEKLRNWISLTTNGMAADCIYERACLHAIYELIERDTTMQFWYKKIIPFTQYCWDDYDNENIKCLVEKAKQQKINIKIVEINTEFAVSCALAVIYHTIKGKECIACGTASRLNRVDASKKALLEAAAMWNSLEYLKSQVSPLSKNEISYGFKNIKSFEDHVLLYTYPWSKKAYQFMLKPKKYSKVIDMMKKYSPQEELVLLVEKLKNQGHEIYILDITPDDIKSLGLFVVKAYIPNSVPFFVGEYNQSFSSRLSVNSIKNKWPHPFP